MLMAKWGMMEPLDMHSLKARGPRNRAEELRLEIFDKVNALGIGVLVILGVLDSARTIPHPSWLIALGVLTGTAAGQVRKRQAAGRTVRADLVQEVKRRTADSDALASQAVRLRRDVSALRDAALRATGSGALVAQQAEGRHRDEAPAQRPVAQQGERAIVQPKLVLAMGASAARGLLGKTVNISKARGTPHALEDGSELWVTAHPSYLLRLDGPAREEQARLFDADLAAVKERLEELVE